MTIVTHFVVGNFRIFIVLGAQNPQSLAIRLVGGVVKIAKHIIAIDTSFLHRTERRLTFVLKSDNIRITVTNRLPHYNLLFGRSCQGCRQIFWCRKNTPNISKIFPKFQRNLIKIFKKIQNHLENFQYPLKVSLIFF